MSKNLQLSDLSITGNNGYIWNQVSRCECFGDDLSGFLKAVDYGERAYTSIDAYVQIKKATELFGPMGRGWGIREPKIMLSVPITKTTRRGTIEGTQVIVTGKFWYISNEGTGEFDVMEDIFLDTSGDSMKKVLTGMITKALSYLGWNYDVFRGRFNDVKSFESVASDEDKALLETLCGKIKPAAAAKIKAYHEERGFLKSDVIADIKKIEDALKVKEVKDAGVIESDGQAGGHGADQDK
jgi:hypothetical protein